LNAGNFSRNILYVRLLFKKIKFCLFFMGNDQLSSKQVGSQASCRNTPSLEENDLFGGLRFKGRYSLRQIF